MKFLVRRPKFGSFPKTGTGVGEAIHRRAPEKTVKIMSEKQLLLKIQQYASSCFSGRPDGALLYHNLEHTAYVVKAALKISAHYKISKKGLFVLETAAWFHDIGTTVQMEAHEMTGAGMARTFLEKEQVEEEIIVQICALIMATQIPQHPDNLLEEIICDADLFHLGKKGFFEKSDNLRKERESIQNRTISKKDWLADTLSFMEAHSYHTTFCRNELAAGKASNISELKSMLLSAERHSNTLPEHIAEKAEHESHKEKEKDKPEKGIETMFRITSSNNQRLSDMADNKAHILITVNSIILSAIISLLLRRLEAYNYLAYPTFLLLAVSLTAMTFAILATRPSIPGGTYSQQQLDEKQVNLLFFGNFYKMPLAAYTEGMMRVMDDKDFLYHTLIRDVYGQGAVLGKKYQLLRTAYNIFMYGLILAVVAFILVSFFHPEVAATAPAVKAVAP